ncbi:MAG: signal peptidase II [Campylobacteraceae bacterium 4484_4]|nr:MAG: signal peptidase II [Campylobacteraceae bacterium 4484_4]
MARKYLLFLAVFIVIFAVDQAIKYLFLAGFEYHTKCISFTLTFNKGVAFSMFAFLGPWLKYLQVVLIGGVLGYLLYRKDLMRRYALPIGLILGGGVSNLLDRFIHGGVVDYVYWHCGFDFAIFNFADVMIDLGVLIILVLSFRHKEEPANI